MTNVFQMLGGSFVLVMALMILLWIFYLIRKKADIVDVGWGLCFVIAVWIYFSLGNGLLLRRLLIAGLVTFWGLRLTWYLLIRSWKSPDEDPRYTELIKSWSDKISFRVGGLFLFQGLLAIILSIPFMIICLNRSAWSWWEFAGVVVWLSGIAGEIFADWQLKRFKSNPENQGKVCQDGWWGYSRHPNYFFEWVIWVGYFLLAAPAPGGWVAIISPLLMLYLLLKVSGIPLSEAQALRSKGESYREYQRQVSSFVPWFRSR